MQVLTHREALVPGNEWRVRSVAVDDSRLASWAVCHGKGSVGFVSERRSPQRTEQRFSDGDIRPPGLHLAVAAPLSPLSPRTGGLRVAPEATERLKKKKEN